MPSKDALPLIVGFAFILSLYGQAEEKEQTSFCLEEAVQKLDLPGITLNLQKKSVDIEAIISLDTGMLELVVCKAGTKEHESIACTKAKPSHIHTALLLLGAKPGAPAHGKLISKDPLKWERFPPSGESINVSLVLKPGEPEEKELNIQHFIKRFIRHPSQAEQDLHFPSSTFLFAGSKLIEKEGSKPHYLCDSTGNIISIVTFGDELLCLPEVNDHSNSSLVWEVNKEHLPPLGESVLIRLTPVSP